MTRRSDQYLGRLLMGRYRIVRRIAAGGMGVIYLARAEGAAGYAKPVVVKRLVPHLGEDDTMVRMFVREAHVLAQLSHPHIVDVLDFAEEDGAYLLVLEYVHGYHLGHWYRYLRAEGRPFPADLAIYVVACVLDALHYAHTRRAPDGSEATIVHRDVSPSNVLVDVDGYVKLADFGIARVSGSHTPYKTDTPSIKGKLSYLAPEVLRSQEPTPLSDVFAAGVVLHEVLSGRNEFYRRDVTETMRRIVEHRLSPLDALRDDLPDGIDEIVARATAKEPADRFPTAAAFAAALRKLLPQGEATLQEALRAQAREDFLGRLPEVRNVEPLEALERAWREAAPAPEDRGEGTADPATASSQPPTIAATPAARSMRQVAGDAASIVEARESPAPRASRRRRSWTDLLIASLVIFGAAAAAAYFVGRRPRAEEPRYIVVQSAGEEAAPEAGGAVPSDPADAPSDVTPGGDAGPPDAAEPPPLRAERSAARPRRRQPLQVRLTRAFARQRPRIERCLQRHQAALPATPQVHVRFALEADGRVRSATLSPASEADSPLGRCILAVARDTRFPAPGEPLAIRIPVRLRRR